MIVMMIMMIMLSKTLAPCLDLLKGACLDFLEAPCLASFFYFLKLTFLMTALLWRSSKMPLVIGHVLEDVGDVVAELASGERVDGDVCLFWSCCLPG